MEINEIRPFFVKAMGVLTKLTPEVAPAEEDTFEASTAIEESFTNVSDGMDLDWDDS